MRTALLAAALVLAGCTTPAPPAGGSPPVRHLHLADLPASAHHADDTAQDVEAAPDDARDPVGVAVALVVDGLRGQGLEIVDLGHELIEATDDRAAVRVTATHRLVAGSPHTSVYELRLTRSPGAGWTLAGFGQVQ